MQTGSIDNRDLHEGAQHLPGFHLLKGGEGVFCRNLRYQEVGIFGEMLRESPGPTATAQQPLCAL